MSPATIEGPVNYLALGDLTGVGVGARNGGYVARIFSRILAQRPGSRLTNLCVSGATSSDVLEGQLDRGLTSDPNLVTLGIGINDIGHGFSEEEFARNYEQIISTLAEQDSGANYRHQYPRHLQRAAHSCSVRAQYQQTIVNFNQRLEAIAARYEVTLFDVHNTTRDQLPAHPEFFSGDGFHPSDAGYELWANEMRR